MRNKLILLLVIFIIISGKTCPQVITNSNSTNNEKIIYQNEISPLSIRNEISSAFLDDSLKKSSDSNKKKLNLKGSSSHGWDLNKLVDSIQRLLPANTDGKKENTNVPITNIKGYLSNYLVLKSNTGDGSIKNKNDIKTEKYNLILNSQDVFDLNKYIDSTIKISPTKRDEKKNSLNTSNKEFTSHLVKSLGLVQNAPKILINKNLSSNERGEGVISRALKHPVDINKADFPLKPRIGQFQRKKESDTAINNPYINSNIWETHQIDTKEKLISLSNQPSVKMNDNSRSNNLDSLPHQDIIPKSMTTIMDYTGRNSITNAQQSPIAFPSPTAATLLGEMTEGVDMYTGKINENIPIYTLNSYNIELPITLNYSSSGVRVDDIASSVGMGWNLNAGGCISRVMHSLPDEFSGTISIPSRIKQQNMPVPAYGYLSTKSLVDLSNYPSGYNTETQKNIVRCADWYGYDWASGDSKWDDAQAWDTEPDEFYFHFGKYSGKFVFDQDGNINCIPFQNFKIYKNIIYEQDGAALIPKISQFTIQTDDGYVYYFGDNNLSSVEETQLEITTMSTNFAYGYIRQDQNHNYVYGWPTLNIINEDIDGNPIYDTYDQTWNSILDTYHYYTSSWYLREIDTPSGDMIQFTYNDNGAISYFQAKNEAVRIPNLGQGIFTIDNSPYWCNYTPAHAIQYTFPHHQSIVLDEQQAFTYTLDEVTVKSKKLASITASNGDEIDFLFTTPRTDLIGDKQLDKINIKQGNNIIKSFNFDYIYQQSVPYNDCFDLSPYDNIPNNGPFIDGDYSFVFIKYMILTGNGNQVNLNDFCAHYNAIFSAECKRLLLTKIQEESPQSNTIPPYQFGYNSSNNIPRRFSYSQDFCGYLNQNVVGTTMPLIKYKDMFANNVPALLCRDSYNNPIPCIPAIGWNNSSASNFSYYGADRSMNSGTSQALSLKQVTYPTGGGSKITYDVNTSGSYWYGGLRAKEIQFFPDFQSTTNTITKSYEYSGGKATGSYIFCYPLGTDLYCEDYTKCLADVFSSSNPVNRMLDTKGGIIGYRSVTESITGSGKNSTQYFSPTEIPNRFSPVYQIGYNVRQINCFPYPPNQDWDWQRGISDLNTQTLDDVTKVIKQYQATYDTLPSFFTRKYSWGLIPAISFKTDYIFPNPGAPAEEQLGGSYNYVSGFLYKQQQIQTDYNNTYPGDASKSSSKTTNYEFNIANASTLLSGTYLHTYLKSMSEIGSLGITQKEYYKYSFNYPLGISNDYTAIGINFMQYCGVLNTPIEKISTINQSGSESVTAGEIKTVMPYSPTQTKEVYQVGTLDPIPFNNFTQSTITSSGFQKDPNYQLRLTYDAYDGYSDLLQYHKTDDLNTSYYWGYNAAYPVIKAENVDIATLTTAVNSFNGNFEAFLTTLGDMSNQSERTVWHDFNMFLHLNLPPDARIFTYTYLPMIGMTSKTDQNGISTYYYYDEFNRLTLEKDSKNNIIHSYDYHYGQ